MIFPRVRVEKKFATLGTTIFLLFNVRENFRKRVLNRSSFCVLRARAQHERLVTFSRGVYTRSETIARDARERERVCVADWAIVTAVTTISI